jgi:hypothetical protein
VSTNKFEGGKNEHTRSIAYGEAGVCRVMYLSTLPWGIHGETIAQKGLGKMVDSTPRKETIFLWFR